MQTIGARAFTFWSMALALLGMACSTAAENTPAQEADESAMGRIESDLMLAASAGQVARANTRAASLDSEYAAAARRYPICWDPCTCYLDGIQTSCALVESCLSSGNCVLVSLSR